MRRNGDRNVRGGDRRLSDRGFGVNREGDRGGTPPPFTAFTNTYDTEGGVTETIPYAAHQMVIEAWGGGGGGSRSATLAQIRGGNSGSYGKTTIALNGGHWGLTMNVTVGNHGTGRTGSTGNGLAGTGSKVLSGTFTMPAGLITNGGPGGVNNTNGTAAAAGTGGDVNTAGNTTNNSTGAGAPNGGGDATPNSVGTTPGGGGSGGNAINVNGSDGAKGRVRFSYT